jgi:hypothetical protein
MISLVVGPPRSGTTVLMRACEAGGLPVRVNPDRNAVNVVASDGFRLHDGSLYELQSDDFNRPDFEAWASGHALKVVFSWLEWLPTLTQTTYRVAVIERDHEELRQAHEAARIQTQPVEWFAARYTWAREQLQRPDVSEVRTIRYADLVFDPMTTLASLEWGLDVEQAAAVVDPLQYVMRNPETGVEQHARHPYLTVGL